MAGFVITLQTQTMASEVSLPAARCVVGVIRTPAGMPCPCRQECRHGTLKACATLPVRHFQIYISKTVPSGLFSPPNEAKCVRKEG